MKRVIWEILQLKIEAIEAFDEKYVGQFLKG